MSIKIFKGVTYYSNWMDIGNERKKGDRVCYATNLGYYIVKTKKNSFWDNINIIAVLFGIIIGFLISRCIL